MPYFLMGSNCLFMQWYDPTSELTDCCFLSKYNSTAFLYSIFIMLLHSFFDTVFRNFEQKHYNVYCAHIFFHSTFF